MEGKSIDGFIVGDYIGRGSFGVVYKAYRNGEHFAVKFIDMQHIASAYDDPKRLDREIEALKRVKSPYTVEYVADGYFSENHVDYKYIVMEYVEGETLEKILVRNPAPWTIERSIKFISDLLDGLSIVHQHNVIHRDLKPDNIAICADGQLKIIDYGLSKIIDFSSLTQSGTRIGAPHFMSPEQILDGKNITYVSDYYAIGVIFYLLLTGQLLFESVTEQEITYKTVNVRPPLPSSFNPQIPTYIENVVLRLLSKEAYERYKSKDDILASLQKPKEVQVGTGTNAVKFYPRLMNNDASIIEAFLNKYELDGVDFPIHEHKRSKKLMASLMAKKDKLDFFADPGTNRMVYTSFRKTQSLVDLPYAPQGFNPYEVEDFEDPDKLRGFVKSVIDLQVASGCSIITAPFFYFDNPSDDWFKVNIHLLRESHSYLRTAYPGYSLSAAICTQAEMLSRKKDKKNVIDQYAHCEYEYIQLYVDCIKENTNDAQLYNFIDTGLALKRFTNAKLIAGRVPAVGLGLLTVGFDGFTSGLAVLDTFEKSIIERESEMAQMPIKHYFPDLLLAVTVKTPSGLVQDIISQEGDLRKQFPQHSINFAMRVPDSLKRGLSANNQVPKIEFLFSRTTEISEINSSPIEDRKTNFIKRIDKAIELRKALGRSIKMPTNDGLKTWKDVLKQF